MGNRRALWLWGILVVAGCKDEGGGNAVGPVPEAEAPQTAVNVICDEFVSCGCDPANAAPDGCEASIDEQVRQAQGDATAAGLEYDAACMGQLLSLYRELDCRRSGDFTLDELITLSRKYDCKVFYGTDQPGQPCETIEGLGDSCANGSMCYEDLCVALTDPAAEGEECDAEVDFLNACVAGTYCFDIDGDERPTCIKIPELNDPCLGSLQLCGEGLACFDGTCLVAPGEGEECHLMGGNPCAKDLTCNLGTGLCESLPEGGESCTSSCVSGFDCEDGRCVAQEPIVCSADIYDGEA